VDSEAPEISVIVPVRDRSGARLDNCLGSLRWQRHDGVLLNDRVEIIVSDFGSESPHREAIRELAAKHGARVVRTETREVWNRSLVLNIGIRASTGRHVLATDADMVFEENFLGAALDALERNPDAFVCCQCHDLPERLADQPWDAERASRIPELGTVRNFNGTGACQAARREFFEAVRGYDQGYVYWGSEDRDMFHRAERYGLQVEWLNERTCMGHQWHPTLRDARKFRASLNNWRYKLTRWRVVKNNRAWGQHRGLRDAAS
jgi:glycosyltransferase involved in cell wall biosynthesis